MKLSSLKHDREIISGLIDRVNDHFGYVRYIFLYDGYFSGKRQFTIYDLAIDDEIWSGSYDEITSYLRGMVYSLHYIF